MAHRVSALPQEPAQNIDGYEGSEIANVSVVVDGWAAGVHADFAVAKGTKVLDPGRQSIKKTKRHRRFEYRETKLRCNELKMQRTKDSRVGQRVGQIAFKRLDSERRAGHECVRAGAAAPE
jgi:hypothetical protein